MRTFLRDNGLTIALILLFAGSLVGHLLAGHAFENQQLAEHGQRPIGLQAYITHPQFLSTLFENWESEFLQMSTYVVLTAYLFQRGSSESNDPDEPPRDERTAPSALTGKSPPLLRGSARMRWLYGHSLGIILFLLFIASFVAHWLFSAKEAASEAMAHGQEPVDALAYLFDATLWFESFQNWQSEFLSTAVLIVLSIYLREKRSPESKPVGAPHEQTGS
jgi:membrane protein implicated in regulation of membrane protease activity